MLTLSRPNRLVNMYMLSPFVWREGDEYQLLVRAVPRRDDDERMKVSEIWFGRSSDGYDFDMRPYPVIFPGPQLADLDGCEDPTVRRDGDQLRVWYTGFNARENVGRLLFARGPDLDGLAKAGVAVDSRPPLTNPKEASLAPCKGGGWRLFFEAAQDGLSVIGQAMCDRLDGPWRDVEASRFTARADRWDRGHLSPGPIIRETSDHPIMFYNGADKEAAWRIGWAVLDPKTGHVTARCEDPLITPPKQTNPSASDIAFAASAVEEGATVRLYYAVSDMDLKCAEIRVG